MTARDELVYFLADARHFDPGLEQNPCECSNWSVPAVKQEPMESILLSKYLTVGVINCETFSLWERPRALLMCNAEEMAN